MGNNFTETRKPHDRNVVPDLVTSSPICSDSPLLFQIFFLNHDESQSVEVLETDAIDLEEILQRLKTGETVFIKPKNQEPSESRSKTNTEDERKFWYFTHC